MTVADVSSTFYLCPLPGRAHILLNVWSGSCEKPPRFSPLQQESVFADVRAMPAVKKKCAPISDQGDYESRRCVWNDGVFRLGNTVQTLTFVRGNFQAMGARDGRAQEGQREACHTLQVHAGRPPGM